MSGNNKDRGFERGPITPENQNTNKEKIRQLEEEKSENKQEINKLKRTKKILAAAIKKAERRGEENKDRGVGKGISGLNELIKEHETKIKEINEKNKES